MRFTDFKIVEAKRRQKNADKVRGKEPMPKAKPGRVEHPFRGRLVGESVNLNEGARIDHAEDLVFWEGSRGAVRALESLRKLEDGGHADVTIKWDGSPAVIFGRNEDGEFILTDKSGFGAVGYDGKAKSAKDLEAMLMARPGAKKDPKGYGKFIANMKDIFDEYEKAVSKDFRGFLKGDLLYFNTPEIKDGYYVFTPNIVTYSVKVDSDLGNKIGQSKTGVVIHRLVDEDGIEKPLSGTDVDTILQGNEVLILPPVTVEQGPNINDSELINLRNVISKNAKAIDDLINTQTLIQKKMKDLPKVFYAYMNSKVDTGLGNLGADFLGWITNHPKLSEPKKKKIAEHIAEHQKGFTALWSVVSQIMKVKDEIINQFDTQDQTVKQEIGSHGPVRPDAHGQGGEGYVLAHPDGDIKLVPRQYFTKANRSVER